MKNTPIALCFLALALCAACGGANIPSHSGGALMPPTSFGVYNASDWYEPRPVAGRPGMLALKDGTVIAAPPNMQPQTSSTSCPNPHWQGNAPPSCTNSGPFRRVYAQPTENGISGYIYLPKDGQPKMPKGVGSKNNPNGDTGYIYMSAYTSVGASNIFEVGVFFQAQSDNYAMYASGKAIKWAGIKGSPGMLVYKKAVFPPGAFLAAAMWPCDYQCGYYYPPSKGTCPTPCMIASISMSGISEPYGYIEEPAPGWVWNCCEFAKMTTIAQTPGKMTFSDGSYFGKVQWQPSGSGTSWRMQYCNDLTEGNCWGEKVSPFGGGGLQSWPNDSNIIVVTDRQAEVNETDAINLCASTCSKEKQ